MLITFTPEKIGWSTKITTYLPSCDDIDTKSFAYYSSTTGFIDSRWYRVVPILYRGDVRLKWAPVTDSEVPKELQLLKILLIN